MSSAQDSVQTVSLWMIHHKKHADDMAFVWLDQLKKASKADRRLVLFYLANDVLQNSRKKGKEFSHAFTKILREAMQLLSEKAIKGNVERVIKIWEERKLFEKDYLEALRTKLDRTGGGKFCEEYELATSKLEDFSGTLLREQQERKNIIKVLEDGEAFYDVSYGEVKVIVHAYKTFGNRLTSLKKKVDSKVNRLAQKEAEKAKTGPVSAPQASFLTSGLPDVAEGSAPSTPTQAQQNNNKSPEEDKPIDPTVDNIEVADMDIEDDSDSEKSDTSEEASVEDPKSSNDQTPNSTESSDSQPGQSTTQELEITPVISPVASVAPARPLTSNIGTMMPLRGSMLPNQPRIGPPRPPVGVIIRPFMGVQGVRFPAHTPQFRPGVRPIQPHPGMAQNQLLRPSGIVPGPGQIPRQGQPFSQMQRPTGLLPNANAHLPGSMGMMQPFPLGSGFVHSQAPLPLAVTTVSAPVQVITNSVPRRETSQDNGRGRDVGSPDSETSAPSPVGSPELNLVEGDETPETTPAPLGDVDVNDNTGFQTNKSFFENPVKSPTTSLGLGFSGAPSVAKTFVPTVVSESPSSSNSTPSTSDQLGGQDAALAKKDNGQKVSAVDILAQLLSRGRKMQQPNDTDAHSASITPPVAAPIAVAVPVATQENSDEPQSKPLLSLIDSLFPKLSDSIKTLKEKEKAGNSPNPPVVNIPTSLPARPLPSEGQFQHPSNIGREQPQFQQTGLRSI
ncbi:Regulation of nuclear pre-mRNA domain-containing protein 2 [Desmophyllum pertusum]|uniref:Regulation of nuclear pre-mRNA domain-containing protein 2 n=1 Tax=Desmophyllum pertusum TaxID=174260 RepID=A0A9W9YTC6_9CNID|nr:Regulation of nuclear pre-mRNA domain-containing protein 2 [Desmophyllum pertusum]